MNKTKEIKRIINLLSWWVSKIKISNANGFNDINKISEDLARRLLNEIYGYNLENLSTQKKNHPVIDLAEREQKIAFQITSKFDRVKIRQNLEEFNTEYRNIYANGIRFLILSYENFKLSSGAKVRLKSIDPNFDIDKHILTVNDLTNDIKRIYDSEPARFDRIKNILEKEIGKNVKKEENDITETEGENSGKTESSNEEERFESVFPAGGNDQPSKYDLLGFTPYVTAIAEFLTNESTEPPLVLSIEGEWGSGKSSFMLQLRDALTDAEEKKRFREQKINRSLNARLKRWFSPWKPMTVWFNPWRHEKEDALWAAFALQFLKQVSSKLNWMRRQVGEFLLFYRRFKWREGGGALFCKAFFSILWISVMVAIPVWAINDPQWVIGLSDLAKELFGDGKNTLQIMFTKGTQLGGITAYIVFLIAIYNKFKKIFGNPLQIDLEQYLHVPNYENRVTFIEHFHNDFDRILSSYVGNRRVYVFIDDLDRCDVPKAADLMQSLNMMISSDPKLVFIIGMDREKVAAGLAVKHEKLLKYIYIPSFTVPESEDGLMIKFRGLEYGFDFIEKFVQLPFTVPVPTGVNLDSYLESLTGTSVKVWSVVSIGSGGLLGKLIPAFRTKRKYATTSISPGVDGKASDQTETEGLAETAADENGSEDKSRKELREKIKVMVSIDYYTIDKVIKLVANALERNPRRIKQFINLFRLRVYIAAETGLFDGLDEPDDGALTLEQLGKFVAIQLKWPLLLVDQERFPTLIKDLQLIALSLGETSNANEVTRWSKRNNLMTLLREGCFNDANEIDEGKRRLVSLENVDFAKLLQVSRKIRNIESQIKEKEDAGTTDKDTKSSGKKEDGKKQPELLNFERNSSDTEVDTLSSIEEKDRNRSKEIPDIESIVDSSFTDKSEGDRESNINIKKTIDRNDFKSQLSQLKKEFLELSRLDGQKKGFLFEEFLFELFELFNLNPKNSFINEREQIDGSFQMSNESNDFFLLEAKWTKREIGIKDLGAFHGKVSAKGMGTRGLFISMSGFTVASIKSFAHGVSVSIIGMDGEDLMHILEERIALPEAIKMKIRHAAETNEFFVPLSKLLSIETAN